MKFLSPLASLLDRLCVVVGAFVGSQIPEFMHQYTQRLAGHVDELQRLLNQMQAMASYSNKSVEQYIQKFMSSSDSDFAKQGEWMQGIIGRWEELHHALYHLSHSTIWMRPYVFIRDLQTDIAHATLSAFQPGLHLTLEGLSYASLGILMGWGLYQFLSSMLIVGCVRARAIFKQSV